MHTEEAEIQAAVDNFLRGCAADANEAGSSLGVFGLGSSMGVQVTVLVGLVGRSDLNGKIGTLRCYSVERQRYEVEVRGQVTLLPVLTKYSRQAGCDKITCSGNSGMGARKRRNAHDCQRCA